MPPLSLSVGQTIWLILDRSVTTALVTEERICKTLRGESTNYFVQIKGSEKNLLLDPDADLFTSKEAVREALILRAKESIEKMLNEAEGGL